MTLAEIKIALRKGDTMNRETWLIDAAERLNATVFLAALASAPENVRYSCGWPGGGDRNTRIGECWYEGSSADSTIEIFISPVISDAVQVLDILAHEMIHAIHPTAGHKGPFRKLALAIGLTGKMTATTAGPELTAKLENIAAELGAYPHGSMSPGSGRKKQTTRMIKAECAECGYTLRLSRKWAENVGAVCPDHGHIDMAENR